MRVSFDDAYRDIAGRSQRAASWVQWWEGNSTFRDVVPFVKGFVHEKLFDITTDDVESVLAAKQHALADIEKEEQMEEVEDLELPPFAIQDLFHRYVERQDRIPKWEEFREYLLEPETAPLFIDPMWQRLRPELPADYEPEAVKRALHWRIGKMYYSVLREIDFLTRVRKRHDIALKYHLLADVRLRTDFWLGDSIVSVFLSNPRYRAGAEGRKRRAREFLQDASPPFSFVDAEFENQFARGKLYRITDDVIDRVAEGIQGPRSG